MPYLLNVHRQGNLVFAFFFFFSWQLTNTSFSSNECGICAWIGRIEDFIFFDHGGQNEVFPQSKDANSSPMAPKQQINTHCESGHANVHSDVCCHPPLRPFLGLAYLDYTGAFPVRASHLCGLFKRKLVGAGSIVSCTFSTREGNFEDRIRVLREVGLSDSGSWTPAHALYAIAVTLAREAAAQGLRVVGANAEGLMDYAFHPPANILGTPHDRVHDENLHESDSTASGHSPHTIELRNAQIGHSCHRRVSASSHLCKIVASVAAFATSHGPAPGQKPSGPVSALALRAQHDVELAKKSLCNDGRATGCSLIGSAWRLHPSFDPLTAGAQDFNNTHGKHSANDHDVGRTIAGCWPLGRGPHSVLGGGGRVWPDVAVTGLCRTARKMRDVLVQEQARANVDGGGAGTAGKTEERSSPTKHERTVKPHLHNSRPGLAPEIGPEQLWRRSVLCYPSQMAFVIVKLEAMFAP